MFVDAVKTPVRDRVTARDMIAVVRKLLTRGEARGLTDDLVTFDDELAAVGVGDDPFPAQQRHGAVGGIVDRDEVDERVRFVSGERRPAIMIGEFVESGREPGDFA